MNSLVHLHPFSMVPGGVFVSLVDEAAYWALYAEVEEGKWMATVEMKLNFLAPARAGKLVAEGRRIKLGRTLGLGEALPIPYCLIGYPSRLKLNGNRR